VFKRILNDAFTFVFWNLEAVFKICGAWFVLQLVLTLVVNMITGGSVDPVSGAPDPAGTPTPTAMLASLVLAGVGLVASASISVAWHRLGLLGERPGMIHLHIGPVEGRFIGKMLLITLATFAVALPVGVVVGLVSGGSIPLMVALLAVAGLIFAPHLMRLYLALPAVAVERPIGLKEAHGLGKGLGWPMFGAGIVLALPFLLASFGLTFLIHLAGTGLPALFILIKVTILNLLLQVIITVLGISVITAGYRIAMERTNTNDQETPSNQN
jgi:hypothetical protein